MKILMCQGQITLSNIDEICQLSIQNQISIISMHTPSLVKIHWYLFTLSSRKEKSDMSRTDDNWRNLPISSPKPDLHNINAYTKFGENPLTFTQVIIRKWKYRRMDRHTDYQRKTIIPRHYCVAGYIKSLYGICIQQHILCLKPVKKVPKMKHKRKKAKIGCLRQMLDYRRKVP